MDFEAKVVGQKKLRADDRLVFEHSSVEGEDFSGQKLWDLSIVGSRFEACRFERMRVESASFGAGHEQSVYLECSFDGSRMSLPVGGNARFEHCSFRDVDFRDWFCFSVEMVDCTFSGKLRKAWFNGIPLEEDQHFLHRTRNEFRGNDFSHMELIEVAFRTGIDLTLQRLPQRSQYVYIPNAQKALSEVRRECVRWTDLELRRSALAVLEVFDDMLNAGQRQLFLNKNDLVRDEADRAVFDMLGRFAVSPPG
jgi:hypothetical protein